MIAAFLANTGVRVHTFQGEVWESKRGPMRMLLKMLDALIARLATHRLVVGKGEQEFLERQGVLAQGNSTVLGSGSIAGVDVRRFRPDKVERAHMRTELGISEDQIALMYLGRVGRDKGVLDLARAFARLVDVLPDAQLLFVGPDEDRLTAALQAASGPARQRVHFFGYTRTPERYLRAADILCLPSYREGFGLVLIESGACGVPVVASRLYGTSDALVDGVTGVFHQPGDVAGLAEALCRLGCDAELRKRMGTAGRERAEAYFRTEMLVGALAAYYEDILCSRHSNTSTAGHQP
jgi:glycosyltransferase involved in cell wall biosynthesis